MGHKVGLDLEDISFVHECFFVLNKDNGKEQIFLEYWEKMALFFELNNFCRGEGHTIGLAAAMAGIEIRQDVLRSLKVFKEAPEYLYSCFNKSKFSCNFCFSSCKVKI
jgi:hypothetical protein